MQPCSIQNLSSEQVQQLGDLPWWRSALRAALLGYISVTLVMARLVGVVAEDVPGQRTCLS